MRVCCVYGASTPPGRLGAALDVVEHELAAGTDEVDRLTPDGPVWPADARERIAAADAVVLASPVYRASFPAVLKSLLDLLEVEDLHQKPVGLLVVGHSPAHQLGVRRHVADVLEWFGAVLVPTQVYCLAGRFVDGRPDASDELSLRQLARTVLRLGTALQDVALEPAPLAAGTGRNPTTTTQETR